MIQGNVDALLIQIKDLQSENAVLKEQLDYQTKKHEQWKGLATIFHDTLWKMIDQYVMKNSEKNSLQ
ncbi:MAG: hypothetical protein ACI4DS_06655 [Eubacterium sp.]